jgi:hypothetical protein
MVIFGYISILLLIICIIAYLFGGLLLTFYIIENDRKYLSPARWWLGIGLAAHIFFLWSSNIFLKL